ncbi:MAG TPA: glycerol-3-phosphate dehydrogenase [Legionella sp.]|nr:glycerol-3-phosphate dehydrogenase [Legionella sp.]
MKTTTIALLGAGSWGTAVAIHLSQAGHQVMLWGHNPQHVLDMQTQRCNRRFLPDTPFPATLFPTADLNDCLNQATHVIIAVPSHAFSSVLNQFQAPPSHLAWLTKGIDPNTHWLLSQWVAEKWGESLPLVVISGPSFAREVAQALPTALVLAGNNPVYLQALQTIMHHDNMRVYLSDDMIGVQLCGAVKNVLAIACGISDGLQYGANAKAALITRGLAEMSRLGIRLGAKQDTFMGLAGVGDLVLTCTDDQSRNRRFGLEIGRGVGLLDAEKHIGQVVEGKYNAAQVCAIAQQQGVDMPICTAVNALLEGRLSAEQAVMRLMNRPPKEE